MFSLVFANIIITREISYLTTAFEKNWFIVGDISLTKKIFQ